MDFGVSQSVSYNQSVTQSYDFNAEKQSWEEGGREDIGMMEKIIGDFGKYFYEQEKR